MDYSVNQTESLPESFNPGGVYFDKETGGIYVAQDSSTKKQFGGTVTGISAPQPAGSFTASNPGVNAVQKVSNTSSQGSTDVSTSIVYINGTKLIAMSDGETISYGGNLSGFLQSNLVQGKLFMLSTADQGSAGFGGRPVSVEQQGSTHLISLVSHGTPHNKIINWTVTSSNQVTRNDTVLTSGGTSIPADIIIDESLLQESSGGAIGEEPELVTLLKPYIQTVNAGTTSILPKLFVKKKTTESAEYVGMYKLYPASFNGNTGEVDDGQFIIYPGILSYYGSNDDGRETYFYSVSIMYVSSVSLFVVKNATSFALPKSIGSSSLVLAQNGTWVNLPSSITVDSELSEDSTNPVQNKAVTAALGEKQGKFSHGGTLQVSSINGNTALSAGSVDENADYVEVQYTGSSDASFDFNSKFSANWFKDRQDKPQRMLLRNNSSSATLTVTTSPNGNFSYNFVKVTLPAGAYVEFLVYKSIVAATASKNSRNPEESGVVETGHEVVKTDGDGTKFLNDAGQYTAIPQQERGTMVFFSNQKGISEVGKGMGVPKSSLKPSGIIPVVGKDIVIQIATGSIGLITDSDLQYYWLSYDNDTFLQIPQSVQ